MLNTKKKGAVILYIFFFIFFKENYERDFLLTGKSKYIFQHDLPEDIKQLNFYFFLQEQIFQFQRAFIIR